MGPRWRQRRHRGVHRLQPEHERVGQSAGVGSIEHATAVWARREQTGNRHALLVESPRCGIDQQACGPGYPHSSGSSSNSSSESATAQRAPSRYASWNLSTASTPSTYGCSPQSSCTRWSYKSSARLGLLDQREWRDVVSDRLIAESLPFEIEQYPVLAVVEGAVDELGGVGERYVPDHHVAVEGGVVEPERGKAGQTLPPRARFASSASSDRPHQLDSRAGNRAR